MTDPVSKRAHVTGGSGFLGGFVIPRLRDEGFEVTALARSDTAARAVEALGATVVRGDLDDAHSLEAAFTSAAPGVLVNLASLGFGHAPTIVQAALTAGLRRAVFVSTTAIFTQLNAPSKAVRTAGERTIQASGLQWTIVRPTMIYGTPDDRNMWRLLRQLRRLPVVPMPGGGTHLQQPIHVADLAQAIVAALRTDVAIGKAYDVAGPEAITFRQIVGAAGAAVGRSPRALPLPARPIIRLLARVERSGRALPVKAEQIERLIEDKAFDISEAVADLGFAPRSFDEGIRAEAAMGTR